MVFARQPLLKPEIEEKLEADLEPLWTDGLTAKQIAERLEFGTPEGTYKKLKPMHVYFYREKFGFRRRKKGIKKNRPRYKDKQDTTMDFTEFQETLNDKVPKSDDPKVKRKRAYLILSFWTPLRKSEIIERVRKDFTRRGGRLKINLYRKKKFYRKNAESEPFFLPLSTPMLDEVVDWIFGTVDGEKRFQPDERPFNFTGWTAWKYVHDVFDGLYPHFFRFDWVTKAIENADNVAAIIPELLRDTGMDVLTIMSYVMKNPKQRTSITDREIEILRAAGVEIP
jgi:hypothetical protein